MHVPIITQKYFEKNNISDDLFMFLVGWLYNFIKYYDEYWKSETKKQIINVYKEIKEIEKRWEKINMKAFNIIPIEKLNKYFATLNIERQ